jgi:cell division protein FtsB
MKRYSAHIIFGSALLLSIFIFLGDSSFSTLTALKSRVHDQRLRNQVLSAEVGHLQREVYGLARDSETLERYARKELGLARKDEYVFIFPEDVRRAQRASRD